MSFTEQISLDGSIVLKSCYADIPAQTRQLCDDEGFLDCKKCSGENCNSDSHREGRKCHQCEGADCLVIATASTLVDCRSTCYVGVNCENSLLIRKQFST